eukprot:jgi/Mesen1/6954/ME000360S06214
MGIAVQGVELAHDAKTILGECPVCLPSGKVYFIDTDGKRVHYLDSSNGATGHVQLDQMIGCVVPRASGGLLVAMEAPIVAINVENKEVGEEICSVPAEFVSPKFRFNDGKCDPEGRFWAGFMNHAEWQDPKSTPGKLFVVKSSKKSGGSAELSLKLPEAKLPNGMAWTSDRRTFFLVDSFFGTVDAYSYDAATGDISNRRNLLTFPESEGQPDGMCIDSADKLWVAMGETGTVRQYDSETSKELSRVQLPVERPTSCAFGGKDLSELYVTTREEPAMPFSDIKRIWMFLLFDAGDSPSPGAGGLFRCHISGVKGASFADAFSG